MMEQKIECLPHCRISVWWLEIYLGNLATKLKGEIYREVGGWGPCRDVDESVPG